MAQPIATIDTAPAAFLSDDAAKVTRPHVFRFDSRGQRFYYNLDAENNPCFLPSVTSVIKATTPMSPGLLDWYSKLGMDEARKIMNEKAAYGTFMHIVCAGLLANGVFDLDHIEHVVNDYVEAEGITCDTSYWAADLAKDLLAFAAFCAEKDVKPIAIEIPLLSTQLGYAGTIDLVCEMTFNRKTVRAIVDMKSGKKGFYEDYEIQLEAYKQLWNNTFPELPVSMVFNWAPKDWRDKPTYDLKNQSESLAAAKWPLLLEIYKAAGETNQPRSLKRAHGTIVLGRELTDNYEIIEAADYIKRHHDATTVARLEEAANVESF
jgi:hypothetical protein